LILPVVICDNATTQHSSVPMSVSEILCAKARKY
jgi:hypothetical protein